MIIYLYILLMFLGGGLFLVFAYRYGFRRIRLIKKMPTSSIGNLPMGLVEVVGKAKISNPIKSPLSNTECVYYFYTVLRRGGKNVTILTKGSSSEVNFQVNDGTGCITVVPKNAEVFFSIGNKTYSHKLKSSASVPQNLMSFGKKQGIMEYYKNDYLIFSEWCILQGQKIYILGTAHKIRGNFIEQIKESGSNTTTPKISKEPDRQKMVEKIRELKANPFKMKAIDTNGDQKIGPEEWDAAVLKIKEQILAEEQESNRDYDLIDTVISKGPGNSDFIISTSENWMIFQIVILSFLSISIGLGLLIFGIICSFHLYIY